MIKQQFFTRLFFFFIGIIILSLGISMIIQANLGVSAWDVLHVGLYKTLGLTIGTWSQIVGLSLIGITFFLDRSMISLGTILNIIFIGIFMDIFLIILPIMDNIYYQYITLISGTVVMGFGAGLYITAKIGTGPRDGLLLALNNRLNISVGKIKTTMELTVLFLGWLLGGPVFIGTILVSIAIGPLMQFTIPWWERRLRPVFKEKPAISTDQKLGTQATLK